MRAGFLSLAIAIVAAAAATSFLLRPFEPAFHQWAFAVAAAIAGLLLLAQGIAALRPASVSERFAALGAFGGALLCAAMVSAAFAVGPPHALPGSPAQTTRVRAGASVAVRFPALTPQQFRAGATPDSVEVLAGAGAPVVLRAGDTRRFGQYVLRVGLGPVALVRATAPDGRPATITQPQGASFVSPYLLFPGVNGEQRYDFFAVPPLHRTVEVVYYPSYRDETKGIVIASPFVLAQITEENGRQLYRGATISGRPLRAGGVVLIFTLGRFPVVLLSSAPAVLPYVLGLLMLAAGLIGYAFAALGAGMPERTVGAAK